MTAIVPRPSSSHSALRLLDARSLDMPHTFSDDIRAILRDHGRLAVDVDRLADESNLYESGLTSHASVNVMLALEGEFDVEFPDHMLKRGVFGSISSIRAAIAPLMRGCVRM